MASNTFQNFLHASLVDPVQPSLEHNPLRQTTQFRQSYRGNHRPLSMMQCSDVACYGLQPHDQPAHLHPDFPSSFVENPDNNSSANVANEHAHISDFMHNTGSQALTGPESTPSTLFMPFRPAVGSFSSASSASTSFQSATEDLSWQSDVFDRKPNMSVLSKEVDTSKYKIVDDCDWALSSVDYEASSPSSVDTSGTGPLTPISPIPPVPLHFHPDSLSSSFDSIVPKTEGIGLPDQTIMPFSGHQSYPFTNQCQCMTCLTPHVGDPMVAPPWHTTQPSAHSLNHPIYHPHAHGRYDDPLNAWHNLAGQQTGLPRIAESPVGQPATSSLQELERVAPEPTPSTQVDSGDEMDQDSSAQDETESAVRRDRDQYLLSMRAQGLSYKEIKRRGRFREAESTLRGRVRVLTKDKSERVRKPEWTDNDVALLHSAVDRFMGARVSSSGEHHGRIPWKKISGWMRNHGSSYLFAPATCAKKWKELF